MSETATAWQKTFTIPHRHTGEILWEGPAKNMRKAVETALKDGVSLAGADLGWSDLGWSDLRGANLRWSDLRGSDLRGANLGWSDLRWADLRWSDLGWSDLRGANLRGAILSLAQLESADTTAIHDDFIVMLRDRISEIPALRAALVEGRIEGSAYEGDCACLVGTIANILKCDYRDIPRLKPDRNRPIERWFLAIELGDTPKNNPVSTLTMKWLDEFAANIQA